MSLCIASVNWISPPWPLWVASRELKIIGSNTYIGNIAKFEIFSLGFSTTFMTFSSLTIERRIRLDLQLHEEEE